MKFVIYTAKIRVLILIFAVLLKISFNNKLRPNALDKLYGLCKNYTYMASYQGI